MSNNKFNCAQEEARRTNIGATYLKIIAKKWSFTMFYSHPFSLNRQRLKTTLQPLSNLPQYPLLTLIAQYPLLKTWLSIIFYWSFRTAPPLWWCWWYPQQAHRTPPLWFFHRRQCQLLPSSHRYPPGKDPPRWKRPWFSSLAVQINFSKEPLNYRCRISWIRILAIFQPVSAVIKN